MNPLKLPPKEIAGLAALIAVFGSGEPSKNVKKLIADLGVLSKETDAARRKLSQDVAAFESSKKSAQDATDEKTRELVGIEKCLTDDEKALADAKIEFSAEKAAFLANAEAMAKSNTSEADNLSETRSHLDKRAKALDARATAVAVSEDRANAIMADAKALQATLEDKLNRVAAIAG